MSASPSVIVFDVNETLSDMSPMAERSTDVGAPAQLAKLWFATLLRDGFALTAAGASRPFAELAVDALRTVLHGVDIDRDLDAAIEHVMAGFWSSMQRELLDRHTWATRTDLAAAIFEWIEGFYNPYRRHTSLGGLSPADFEHRHITAATAA